MVFDPSLFSAPVPTAVWRAAIKAESGATVLTETEPSTFILGQEGADADYVRTRQDLADCRARLRKRTVERGASPYARCVWWEPEPRPFA
jgi:hypothetical protein